jgi:hypothetical protein
MLLFSFVLWLSLCAQQPSPPTRGLSPFKSSLFLNSYLCACNLFIFVVFTCFASRCFSYKFVTLFCIATFFLCVRIIVLL